MDSVFFIVWGNEMNREERTKYEEWIERCINESKKRLTKWEEEFLENISDQIARTGSLSTR